MIRATVQHAWRLGYCSRGMRRWFRRRGWSFTAFVRDGLDVRDLRATGDAMADRLADEAERSD
jgi:hypothetical protein